SVTNCATLTVKSPITAIGPTDVTVCSGQSASLSAMASTAGAAYHWLKDGVQIPTATNATYTIAAVSAADAGSYCVLVRGDCNIVTNCATLTVSSPITASGPTDLAQCEGQSATFSTSASSVGLSYQWRKNGVDINGATNASYTIGAVSMADAGNYCVVVGGACNSVTNCAALSVTSPITASGPTDLAQCEGQSATFSTSASSV